MWFDDVLPLAQQAAAGTGLPVSAVLAQWGLETGSGSSPLSRLNNLAGIKFTGQPGSFDTDGGHAGYTTPQAFLADYVRVVKLSYYDRVRAAAPQGPQATIGAWKGSPYAEDPNYADSMLSVWNSYGLARYDQAPGPATAGGGVTIQEAPGQVTILHPAGMALGAVLLGAVALILWPSRS